jgi:hypothetical protein
MKTRKLGTLEVSELGFGCMNLATNYGPAAPIDEAIKVIREAHNKGVTYALSGFKVHSGRMNEQQRMLVESEQLDARSRIDEIGIVVRLLRVSDGCIQLADSVRTSPSGSARLRCIYQRMQHHLL